MAQYIYTIIYRFPYEARKTWKFSTNEKLDAEGINYCLQHLQEEAGEGIEEFSFSYEEADEPITEETAEDILPW